jgi:hypothetical protein
MILYQCPLTVIAFVGSQLDRLCLGVKQLFVYLYLGPAMSSWHRRIPRQILFKRCGNGIESQPVAAPRATLPQIQLSLSGPVTGSWVILRIYRPQLELQRAER